MVALLSLQEAKAPGQVGVKGNQGEKVRAMGCT